MVLSDLQLKLVTRRGKKANTFARVTTSLGYSSRMLKCPFEQTARRVDLIEEISFFMITISIVHTLPA